MAVTLDTLDQKLDMALNELVKHEYILQGNGNPGLIKSVDRLMQLSDTRTWHIRTIWGAFIMAIIGFLLKGG